MLAILQDLNYLIRTSESTTQFTGWEDISTASKYIIPLKSVGTVEELVPSVTQSGEELDESDNDVSDKDDDEPGDEMRTFKDPQEMQQSNAEEEDVSFTTASAENKTSDDEIKERLNPTEKDKVSFSYPKNKDAVIHDYIQSNTDPLPDNIPIATLLIDPSLKEKTKRALYTMVNNEIRHYLKGIIDTDSIWSNITSTFCLSDLMQGTDCPTAFQTLALAVGYQIGFQEGRDSQLTSADKINLETSLEKLGKKMDRLNKSMDEFHLLIQNPTDCASNNTTNSIVRLSCNWVVCLN